MFGLSHFVKVRKSNSESPTVLQDIPGSATLVSDMARVEQTGCIPHFAFGLRFAMLMCVGNRRDFRNLDEIGKDRSWMTGFGNVFRASVAVCDDRGPRLLPPERRRVALASLSPGEFSVPRVRVSHPQPCKRSSGRGRTWESFSQARAHSPHIVRVLARGIQRFINQNTFPAGPGQSNLL